MHGPYLTYIEKKIIDMNRKGFIQTSGLALGFTMFANVGNSIANAKKFITDGKAPKVVKDAEGEVLNVIGDIQTHKFLGADTNNQLVEWVDNVEPGVGIPPHVHTKEDEIFRVIEGQVEIMVDGNVTILNAGDMAFAPKNIPHAWKVVGTEKAKMITSAFPAGIEHMFVELAKLPAGPPDFGQVAEICGRHGIKFIQ